MAIDLDPVRRARLVEDVQGFFLESFDEDVSPFRAEQLLEFFLGHLGPHVYNQGVQDARVFMQRKLDDLDGEVYEPEGI